MVVTLYLDSVVKYRSSTEFRKVPKVYTHIKGDYLEETGDGYIVKKLLQRLYDENKCGIDALIEVKRGDTPVFTQTTLKQWLFPGDRRPEWLKQKWRNVK